MNRLRVLKNNLMEEMLEKKTIECECWTKIIKLGIKYRMRKYTFI